MASWSTQFPVTVVMERRPVQGSRWIAQSWNATAVVVADRGLVGWLTARQADDTGISEHLFGGLHLQLHVDECESYYHNLLSDTPRLFVITREDDQSRPQPFQVTASFDEAHAYLEAEEGVFEVPVPPEIYQSMEAFVLANYVPEKRTKRKRKNWHSRESR